MADLDAIFKAYDVRGIVPDQLDVDLAERIGSAFARFLIEQSSDRPVTRVLVGRDMRPSGVQLAAAFAEGLQRQGIDVTDLGLASTDLVYFAAGKLDAPAAMFTASHNPAQYNGIKLCLAGARPIGEETGLGRIRQLVSRQPAPPRIRRPDDAARRTPPTLKPAGGFLRRRGTPSDAPGSPNSSPELADGTLVEQGVPEGSASPSRLGQLDQLDLLDDFAAHVRSFVDQSVLRPLRVVADTANGMGGLVVPKVFEPLPFELEILYPELDGNFPNHPADPIQPENIRDLQARVRETGADIGLAFDGDADRVFLVDDQAEPLSGSTTTAIVATGILAKKPGATILHNLICSKAVPEIIRENGGKPIRTRVGHSFIKQVMAEEDAAFGGEHSAHYYFADNWRADSGSIAALVVLEQLGKAGVPLSELRRPFDRYAASGELNFRVTDPQAVIEQVSAAFPTARQDRLDGLTVDLGDWWFNLRPSNTEPLLRLNLEAQTGDAIDGHVETLRKLITEE